MATSEHTAGQAGSKARTTYDHLVAGFIAQLEAGTAPWIRPWASSKQNSPGMPHNATTGRQYIRRGGNRACYVPSADFIQLPDRKQFKSRQHDQATALHELAHWTGHESRLDRAFGRRFGDQAYAAEELVAELTAAFVCADLGITGELQHAEYLASWANALKAKPNILWTAASKASEAADYLKNTSEGRG